MGVKAEVGVIVGVKVGVGVGVMVDVGVGVINVEEEIALQSTSPRVTQ